MKKPTSPSHEATLEKMRQLAPVCAFNNLRIVSRLVERLYDDAFRPSAISASQVALLWTVLVTEPVAMTSLSTYMSADQTTLSRVVSHAIELRLLTVERDAVDRRIKLITLTPKGRQKLSAIFAPWKDMQEQVGSLIDLEALTGIAKKARRYDKGQRSSHRCPKHR